MPPRSRGFAMAFMILLLAVALGALVAAAAGTLAAAPSRETITRHALAQAKAALLAYAADRALDRDVGPGHLPCPDRDGDGWAEPTCGSLAGDVGQAQRLGLLPWKTLGLPDLRDADGERLWYAVSTRYKGLLNCAASERCVDLTPASGAGTISVRDASGAWLHDGRGFDPTDARAGAAAVVISPGAALRRADGHEQSRGCLAGACRAEDFLDVLPGVDDNARFVDRAEGAVRAGNGDGFVTGPALHEGRLVVNDRVEVVAPVDLMPRVMMRVAIEAGHCLRLQASLAGGTLPPPAPACVPSSPVAYGRLPDLDLPGCNLGPAAGPGWWKPWRDHVLYAPAPACGSGGPCIDLLDPAGQAMVRGQRLAVVVRERRGGCDAGPLRCTPAGCAQAYAREGRDVAIALP